MIDQKNQWIEDAYRQLQVHARRLLRRNSDIHRWEDTGDLLQDTFLRVLKMLEQIECESQIDFIRLAYRHMRWALTDLARKHRGKGGFAGNYDSLHGVSADHVMPSPSTESPASIVEWGEFHQAADSLPAPLRDVFDLRYYGGKSHVETSELLAVSEKTVRKRWREAIEVICDAMEGQPPPFDSQ